VVDDTLQTYDPRVYAVGECVQHRRATFGLVAPIWDQARVCAAHLAGAGHRRYVQQATATKLKVTGVDLYSAGDIVGGEGSEDLVLRDRRGGVYKRLVVGGQAPHRRRAVRGRRGRSLVLRADPEPYRYLGHPRPVVVRPGAIRPGGLTRSLP
jgi:hypothetical protein